MAETTKRTYTKKTAQNGEQKTVAKKPGKPRQSIARLTAKTVARTAVRRTITGIFGSGLVGSLLGVIASQGIKQTDKVAYNDDFGVFHKK